MSWNHETHRHSLNVYIPMAQCILSISCCKLLHRLQMQYCCSIASASASDDWRTWQSFSFSFIFSAQFCSFSHLFAPTTPVCRKKNFCHSFPRSYYSSSLWECREQIKVEKYCKEKSLPEIFRTEVSFSQFSLHRNSISKQRFSCHAFHGDCRSTASDSILYWYWICRLWMMAHKSDSIGPKQKASNFACSKSRVRKYAMHRDKFNHPRIAATAAS